MVWLQPAAISFQDASGVNLTHHAVEPVTRSYIFVGKGGFRRRERQVKHPDNYGDELGTGYVVVRSERVVRIAAENTEVIHIYSTARRPNRRDEYTS